MIATSPVNLARFSLSALRSSPRRETDQRAHADPGAAGHLRNLVCRQSVNRRREHFRSERDAPRFEVGAECSQPP